MWESRSLNIHGMKETGSPKELFENLDLTPIHPILWTGLHKEGPGRPVEYDPDWDFRALMLRQLLQIPYIKDLAKRLKRDPHLKRTCVYGERAPTEAHFIYGVTACVKHYMGIVSDKLTGGGSHRSVGGGGMGTEMAGTRMPVLNVLDAIWVNANPGKGPRSRYDEATRLNTVMASADPIALDYWASKYVLMQAARLTGHRDLSKIDPDNSARAIFNPQTQTHSLTLTHSLPKHKTHTRARAHATSNHSNEVLLGSP